MPRRRRATGASGERSACPLCACVERAASRARRRSRTLASRPGLSPRSAGPRRWPGRWGARARTNRWMQRLALDQAHRAQVEPERQRRARPHAELHVLPVLARGVVDDGPAYQVIFVLAERHAVARLPRGRLGHVRQAQVVGAGPGRSMFMSMRPSPVVSAPGVVGYDTGAGSPVRASTTDERLEEVVDLVGGDRERQLVVVDVRRPLEVGDAVAVDDDPSERRVRSSRSWWWRRRSRRARAWPRRTRATGRPRGRRWGIGSCAWEASAAGQTRCLLPPLWTRCRGNRSGSIARGHHEMVSFPAWTRFWTASTFRPWCGGLRSGNALRRHHGLRGPPGHRRRTGGTVGRLRARGLGRFDGHDPGRRRLPRRPPTRPSRLRRHRKPPREDAADASMADDATESGDASDAADAPADSPIDAPARSATTRARWATRSAVPCPRSAPTTTPVTPSDASPRVRASGRASRAARAAPCGPTGSRARRTSPAASRASKASAPSDPSGTPAGKTPIARPTRATPSPTCASARGAQITGRTATKRTSTAAVPSATAARAVSGVDRRGLPARTRLPRRLRPALQRKRPSTGRRVRRRRRVLRGRVRGRRPGMQPVAAGLHLRRRRLHRLVRRAGRGPLDVRRGERGLRGLGPRGLVRIGRGVLRRMRAGGVRRGCGPLCWSCPPGSDGRPCEQDTDCVSGACDAAGHECVASQCADHRQDGVETDVDCGGPVCAPCGVGQGCQSNRDCQPGHVCVNNGYRNACR